MTDNKESSPAGPHQPTRAVRQRVLENQVARLNRRLGSLYELSRQYSRMRLIVFVVGLLISGAAFYFVGSLVGSLATILAVIAFGLAVVLHRRVEDSILRHQIWLRLKSTGLARLTLDWATIPSATTGRADPTHPFARDLDLTGDRSIHRLLDTAVSHEGSERLRLWLLDLQPDLATTRRRQAQVRALVPLTYFRDKLSLSAMISATGAGGWWHGERLQAWLVQGGDPQGLRLVLLASAFLAAANIILFTLNSLGLVPNYWIATLLLYVGLLMLTWREVAGLFDNALTLQNGLRRVEAVFGHLEDFPLARYEPLRALCAPFLDPKNRPSVRLRRVGRLVIGIGLAQNPFIGTVLNLFVPWNLFFAHRLRQYRADIARDLPGWLDVWFEIEALSSLATFAYLNPDTHFPTIDPPATALDRNGHGEPIFEAQQLGHPLIPNEQKVRNDFVFHHLGEMGIITGSNMAGKSSFLRTVGVNLRLACIGGPVDAVAFRMSLFRLFTSITVNDSVTDGISFFYAEVKRLKALLNALEQPDGLPLLFMIDEIFRGTNNRERFIGSRAYLRALIGRRGVGLVATHDLELVKLADEFSQIRNYHFREAVVDSRMVFDYQLRPGPCPTTNALKIMQLEGLPVEERDVEP